MNETHDTNQTKPKQYQCRHIFTSGHRCASPCLRGEAFCYYHHTTRKPISNPKARHSRQSTFHLPLPEDRSDVQHSIGEVLQRIAANDIDPRRAGLLLYGLQIASLNLPKEPATIPSNPKSSRTESPAKPQTIEDITLDPTHGILAPQTEIIQPEHQPSFIEMLLARLDQGKHYEDDDQQVAQQPENSPQPDTLTTLQATEEPTTTPARHSERSEEPPHFAFACSLRHGNQAHQSCILKKHAKTDRSYHPRRLGLSRRDPRKRHRSRPQTHLRQTPPRIPQRPHPS